MGSSTKVTQVSSQLTAEGETISGTVYTPQGIVFAHVHNRIGAGYLELIHGGHRHRVHFHRRHTRRSLAIAAGRFARAVVEGRITE